MRRLLLIPLLPFLLAAEKPWPQKGDTVYVAADLTSTRIDIISLVTHPYSLPACKPQVVKDRKPRKDYLILEDDLSTLHALKGEWSTRLHRTPDACTDQIGEEGQPRVKWSGLDYSLIESH